MDIIISARHMKSVSQTMKLEIENRLNKMSFYQVKLTKAEVVMDRVKGGNSVEIVLHGKDTKLEASSDLSNNLYDAVHQAADRLERQLKKKLGRRKRRHNSKHLGVLEVELIELHSHDDLEFEEPVGPRISKRIIRECPNPI